MYIYFFHALYVSLRTMMMIMSQRIVRRNLKKERNVKFVVRKSPKIVKRKNVRRMNLMMRKSHKMILLRNIYRVKKVVKRRIVEIVRSVQLDHRDIKLLRRNQQKKVHLQLMKFVSS